MSLTYHNKNPHINPISLVVSQGWKYVSFMHPEVPRAEASLT